MSTGPGTAIANYNSVADGDQIIKQAFDKWGRVDVLINNAGILRDKSFKGMSDADFDIIQEIHVKGAYKCTKAAWPIFRKQKFGRVIFISSPAGLYGCAQGRGFTEPLKLTCCVQQLRTSQLLRC